MTACGNCGNPVIPSDTTCPHCDALVAAWASAADTEQSVTYQQPDYARPPADTPFLPAMDDFQSIAQSGIGSLGSIDTPRPAVTSVIDQATATGLVNTISAGNKATATKLVNVLHAYARKREAETELARSTASQRQRLSRHENNQGTRISNTAFAIGTALVVALVLMWGIVAAMIFSDMLSVEFMVITAVLTLAFKPIMKNLRRALDR